MPFPSCSVNRHGGGPPPPPGGPPPPAPTAEEAEDDAARKAEPRRGRKSHPIVPSWEDVLLGVRSHR